MTNQLTPAQIEANEAFFTSLIKLIHDGGTYGWPAIQEIFKVRNGKRCGSERGLAQAKAIVSEQFFINHFEKL